MKGRPPSEVVTSRAGSRLLAALLVSCLWSLGTRGALWAQTGSIRGTVRGAGGEPLSEAAVTILGLGRRAFGDSSGVFVLPDVPAGTWRLEARRIGYRARILEAAVQPGQETVLEVLLGVATIVLPEVTAVARAPDRERFLETAQVSTHSLDIRDIRAVPGLAESDLLRSVQLLPGVVARSDFSVGLNVRGGDADQNLVLLDGQVVFNPFHLGGLVSTFADDAVRGIDFLAGGFPARYGGRLSSVLNVDEREGTTAAVRGSVAVSLLTSKLHLEGPLPGRAGSWLVAGRRTYADQLVDAFSSSEFPYYFQDLLARASLSNVGGGVLSASGFASGDDFDFRLTEASTGTPEQTLQFAWGNRLVGATYRRPLGGNAVLTQRLGVSSFYADIEVGPGLFTFGNRVRRVALSGDVEARRGRHLLGAGYVAERHDITYVAASGDLDLEFGRLTYRPTSYEAYLEDQWRPAPWLLLRPGVRLTHLPGSRAGFTRVAPRVAAKAFLGENAAVSVAGGRYYQYIHSLRNEEIPITLFEFWIGTDSNVPVSAADQAVLAAERWFGPGLNIAVEGYWKGMRNLVDQNPEEDPGIRGDEFRTARGAAFGLDFYLRKTTGRLTGWVAYTLGKVSRVAEDGERFAPAQDRRHNLNVVGNYAGPLGAQWTVRVGYGSPLPYTGITGQWVHRFYTPGRNIFIGGEVEPYRSARNALRYPAYARIDLSARWAFNWLGARWYPTAQLLNASARTNVFVYFFDFTENPPVRRGLTQFPFLPTVGLEVEF